MTDQSTGQTPEDAPWGVSIRTNAREARTLSAVVSPTRSFVPTAQRGVYFMVAPDEVLALRDADFLIGYGVDVVAVNGTEVGSRG